MSRLQPSLSLCGLRGRLPGLQQPGDQKPPVAPHSLMARVKLVYVPSKGKLLLDKLQGCGCGGSHATGRVCSAQLYQLLAMVPCRVVRQVTAHPGGHALQCTNDLSGVLGGLVITRCRMWYVVVQWVPACEAAVCMSTACVSMRSSTWGAVVPHGRTLAVPLPAP